MSNTTLADAPAADHHEEPGQALTRRCLDLATEGIELLKETLLPHDWREFSHERRENGDALSLPGVLFGQAHVQAPPPTIRSFTNCFRGSP